MQGVVVFSMSDVPLGFGVAARSTADCRKLDPNAIVVFHQADTGEGQHRAGLHGQVWCCFTGAVPAG